MQLHVVQEGAGPPVVLTHGLGDATTTWDGLAAALRDRFTVVRWDLRGHGRSETPVDADAYTRDHAVDDLDQVLGSLGQPVVLVGHSLGGYLCLARAVRRTDDLAALVLLASGPGFRDPAARRRWNERLTATADRYPVPPQVLGLGRQPDDFVIRHVAEVDVPTLVLVGERDDASYQAGAQYLVDRMPRCSMAVLPGGHRFHVTAAVEVAAAITELAGLAGIPLTSK